MCGIAGFVGRGSEQTLSAMIGTLAHRGPDDTGVLLTGDVGFAHARLSIIDLSPLGHQPMVSISGTTSITFNGEIYNYLELKRELEAKGRMFRSQSDTEVILELYETFGEAAFKKLSGMYAFALFDTKTEALFLVRDRMGEKPLYYAHTPHAIVFASEPKALFEHEDVTRTLNPEGVISFLTHDAVLTPLSIYKNIQKLEAASYLKCKNGRFIKHSYWSPPQKISNDLSFTDAKNKLDQLFANSISSQMIADVPVGVFLSGGLDSSLVAYYAQKARQEKIHTFSIGFDDRSFDESSYARQVAHMLGTDHHERIVSASEVRDALQPIAAKLDEPMADPSILPTHLLARFAREHVKVALGGDGGDELFGGYQTFTAEKMLRWYARIPRFITADILEPLIEDLPVSHRYFSLDFKAKQFLRGAHVAPIYAHQAWLESFNAGERATILTPEYQAHLGVHPYARIDEYLGETGEDAHLRAQYFYLRTYMLDDILTKVDRASMYTALEVRAPFLDASIVEFALALPWSYKFRGLTSKYILRELMQGKLPREIVKRSKHGFGIPVASWFMHEWRELLTDTLSQKRLGGAGVFAPKAVETLITEHLAGTRNHRKKLWSILAFQLWYDAWILK
jgi:asparagine synthase (glutamine-hydrolysing)